MKLSLAVIAWFALPSATWLRSEDLFTVVEQSTVHQHPADPEMALNHGPSVTLLPDGRVMAAWWTAPKEGAPSQRILSACSSDQGRTWTPAEVLQDTPGRADFDPALFVAGRRTFLFFCITEPTGVHFRRSDDSGRTWSAPVSLDQAAHTTRSHGIRLKTGELLVPLHRIGTRAGGVLKSSDEGLTWARRGEIANPDGQGGEPTIAELPGGRVLMILRTKDRQVWQTHSDDRGDTWAVPAVVPGLQGVTSASHLLCLRDGRLVLTRNPGPDPHRFPLVMHLSSDGGKTWTAPVTIATRPANEPGWQTSYPSVIELPDSHLLAIWTQIRGTRDVHFGDIRAARIAVVPGPR